MSDTNEDREVSFAEAVGDILSGDLEPVTDDDETPEADPGEETPAEDATAPEGDSPPADQDTPAEDPGDDEFLVSVTTSNFFDDSVFASRLELMLRRDDVGRFRFVSGEWGQVCQPGRGQQEFSPELCI